MLYTFVRLILVALGFTFFSLSAFSIQSIKKPRTSSSFQITPKSTVQNYISKSKDALDSNLNIALEYAQTALQLIKETDKPSLQYDANNQIATVLFYVGIFDLAAKYWLKCDSIAEQINDDYLIAKSNFQLSALYIALVDYKTAQKHINLAKSFFS